MTEHTPEGWVALTGEFGETVYVRAADISVIQKWEWNGDPCKTGLSTRCAHLRVVESAEEVLTAISRAEGRS